MNTQIQSRFSSRYISIMALSSFVVLSVSAALLFFESGQKIQYEQARYSSEFRSHSHALDNLVVSVGEHLNSFEENARRFLEDKLLLEQSGVLIQDNYLFSFINNTDIGLYELNDQPIGYLPEELAKLSGAGSIDAISKPMKDEIMMSLNLNSLFQAAKENIPSSSWIYYTSKNKFINIYPWSLARGFHFSEELFTHEFYHWGLPEVNKERAAFWTPAYIDEAGQGLMVTAAKPVYRGNDFLGTVAIDVTLNQLIEFAERFEPHIGQMMIVNEQNQLIAHRTLLNEENDLAKMQVKYLLEELPTELITSVDQVFQQDSMVVQELNGRYYMWYGMQSAPWKVLYIFNDDQFNLTHRARLNIDFFFLIAALAIILYLSYKVTFREFIFPAEKLVSHIDLENQNASPAVPSNTPSPWRPWFAEITKVFAENYNLIEEIKQKNETLLEKNTALERYMPKTIVIFSVASGSGGSTIGQFLAHEFADVASDTKSSVYLQYPNMNKSFTDLNIQQDDYVYQHPDGYDIWGGHDFGVMPEDAHPSMLINTVLENYNNVVLNVLVGEDGIIPSEQEIFLNYAKVVIVMTPPDDKYDNALKKLKKSIRKGVRQDKTSVYEVYNQTTAESYRSDSSTIDFVLPYLGESNGIRAHSFALPPAADSLTKELVDRVERVHQISVYLPTTINIDEVIDTTKYIDKTMAFFGEKFGGATCNEANGVWNSSKGDLVSETVNIVVSYTTEENLNMYVDEVIEYVKVIKDELAQDAMAIEINKKLILI